MFEFRAVAAVAVVIIMTVGLGGCGAPPEQAAVLALASQVTSAMRPCDDAYRVYSRDRSAKVAHAAAGRCLDASGAVGGIKVPTSLSDGLADATDRALRHCAVSAGARGAWLQGITDAKLAIENGELNAESQNRLCRSDLIGVASAVVIHADDPRLTLPVDMDAVATA